MLSHPQDSSLLWIHGPFLVSFLMPIIPADFNIVPWDHRPVLLVSPTPRCLKGSRCATKEGRLMTCSYCPPWSSHSASGSWNLVGSRTYRDRKTHLYLLDQRAGLWGSSAFKPAPSLDPKDTLHSPSHLSSLSRETHQLWKPRLYIQEELQITLSAEYTVYPRYTTFSLRDEREFRSEMEGSNARPAV